MTMQYDNLEDKLSQLVEYTKDSGKIDLSLYTEYDVKRGPVSYTHLYVVPASAPEPSGQ